MVDFEALNAGTMVRSLVDINIFNRGASGGRRPRNWVREGTMPFPDEQSASDGPY